MEQCVTIKQEPEDCAINESQSTFCNFSKLLYFSNFEATNNNQELLRKMTATTVPTVIQKKPQINEINQSQPTLNILQNHLMNTNFESTRANFELMNVGLDEVESHINIRNGSRIDFDVDINSHRLWESVLTKERSYSLINDNNKVCTQFQNYTCHLKAQRLALIEGETANERRLRLARENVKRWRTNLSEEAVQKLRQGSRIRKAERRKNQTEEQRLLALYEDRARKRIRREVETSEERLRRQIEDKKRHVMQRITETPEQRRHRLFMDQKRAALRRKRETEEERMRRLLADKHRKAYKRANETPEERIRRLTDARERIAAKRKTIRGNSDNRETSGEETSDDEFGKQMTEANRKTLEWLVKINNGQ